MENINELLRAVADGTLPPSDAEARLRVMAGSGFADMGHTKLDLDRQRRRGVPEAVYAPNKTREQVLEIAERLDAAGQSVICTRVPPEMAEFIRAKRPDFAYNADARMLTKRVAAAGAGAPPAGMVLTMCAGTSDIPVAEEAAVCAEIMGSRVERVYDVGVAGIHRLFGAAGEKLQQARVVVVAAGMEGALPSVVAGLTRAPVIAVPTSVGYGASFGGIAALLGMLNSCSGGIAVVNIDNGFGAGLMAHLINTVGECAGTA
jgi:pyridinium-3,5-biscarboxylic acid mononucleotide synthase